MSFAFNCDTCKHVLNDGDPCDKCYVMSDKLPSEYEYRPHSLTNYDLVVNSTPEKVAEFVVTASKGVADYDNILEFLKSEPIIPQKGE